METEYFWSKDRGVLENFMLRAKFDCHPSLDAKTKSLFFSFFFFFCNNQVTY